MFTTGSKLFIGATTVALVTTIVFAVGFGGDRGWTATVGLVTLTTILAGLTALNLYVRDSNVSGAQPEAIVDAPASRPPATPSIWPAVTGLAGVLLVIGTITEPIVFKAGVVVAIAVLAEWLVQGWAERASADPAYNASIRGRLMHPLEFPVLAAAGLAIIIFSFSRIMLFLSKSSGPVAFGLLAALVLFAGFLFASRQNLRRSVTLGICAIAAVGIVSTGAVTAVEGPRELHEHATISSDPTVCTSPTETGVDEKAPQSVAAKNGLAGTIVWTGSDLYAEVAGVRGPQRTLTIQRSNPTFLMFENQSDAPARLTVNMGAFEEEVNGTPVRQTPKTCTPLIEPDGAAMLTLTFSKPSIATPDEPYSLTVPGTDASIEIVVP